MNSPRYHDFSNKKTGTIGVGDSGNGSQSYNSYYMTKAEKKILKLLDESEITLTPKEIAQKTGLNHSSVRVYVRNLVKKNAIVSPYHGAYCNKITYGTIVVPLKIHNLIISVPAPWLGYSDDITEFVGSVKVRVQFGGERRRLTGRISCDAGMDKNATLFAIDRCMDIMEKRTGRKVEDLVIKTFEINQDYSGIRLDRPQCITRKGLYGFIERIYQKEDEVRHEFKVSKDMTLTEFEETLRGGVTQHNITQANFALIQEVRRLTEVVKDMNARQYKQEKIMQAMLKWIYNFNDKENGK